MKTRTNAILISVVVLVTAIAYLPSLDNGFTNWDDDLYVTENPEIRAVTWQNIRTLFTTIRHGGYEPLTELSFMLEYHFFKLDPRAYHTTNLVIHLINCALVFFFILMLCGHAWIAFISSLLFGIHPLHVESIAWISERKDVLMALFSLGALISYLRYLSKGRTALYYLTMLLFLLALLPKPQQLAFPFVLLLCDYYRGRPLRGRALLEKIPFLIISLAFLLLTCTGASQAGEIREKSIMSLFSNLPNAAYGLVFYLGKLIAPVRLSCLYPYPDIGGALRNPLYPLAPVILAVIIAAVVYSRRSTRKVVFGTLFFLFNIIVVLQIIRTGPAVTADRYTYLPAIGLFYLLGEGIVWLLQRKGSYHTAVRLTIFAACTAGVILFSRLTWQRCHVWKDSQTLWRNVLSNYPRVAPAYYNLGNDYLDNKQLDEAIEYYETALNLDPDYARAHNNLGNALAAAGRDEEAITHYRKAIELNPRKARTHFNLGAALARQENRDEAIAHYHTSLKLNPACAQTHNNLGIMLAAEKQYDEAVEHYREALRANPGYAEVHNNLGLALAAKGMHYKALASYHEALRYKPAYAEAHYNLAISLAKEGKPDAAITHYREALRIMPLLVQAHNNLGNLLAQEGQIDEAIAHFQEALRLKPDYTSAKINLQRISGSNPD